VSSLATIDTYISQIPSPLSGLTTQNPLFFQRSSVTIQEALPRLKIYCSNAEKQAACRQRKRKRPPFAFWHRSDCLG
jgi:hypothetical protein